MALVRAVTARYGGSAANLSGDPFQAGSASGWRRW